MEKIIPGTPDGTEENVERIAGLFPGVVTEVEGADGNLEHVVDFDALRDLLGDVAEGQREATSSPGRARRPPRPRPESPSARRCARRRASPSTGTRRGTST